MTWMNSLVSLMNIGAACSMESSQNRMNLKDASVELLKLKDCLIQASIEVPKHLKLTHTKRWMLMLHHYLSSISQINHSFPRSLSTPDHEREMVAFFIITMILLPVVTCAGTFSSTSGNETDHFALLEIKSALRDQLGVLNSGIVLFFTVTGKAPYVGIDT
ncbi:hypothetical protein Cgig2_014011 [Carnegiea gigantea]|uniref:Uncharacterized protein n=1 Tax=Carnegiea gigantea TaxID=171969 RepID=A0A9Q1KYJ0_9CARY|nr:hypothetical protein Cgig2_014011 [Carnegiea gigantea]